ncbi:MAG TPA: glycosyltransferase family 4 protein [Methylomirabilota bacterium]|nr:glycosyltransferase family 4 protein [Methylomirabilota bacterium]
MGTLRRRDGRRLPARPAGSGRLTRLKLVGFRYAPAIGGAENYSRRLMCEIGSRLDVEVVTLLKTQRTDWLNALMQGERQSPEHYEVDGRKVTALGAWPPAVRRRLRALAPLYHLPGSFAPEAMGRALAPHMRVVADGADVVHNVFMGREAFSIGALLATRRAGLPFVFTPLRHERPLGWNSPAFRRIYREADAVIALTHGEADWLTGQGAPRSRLHVIGIGPQNDPEAPAAAAKELVPGDRRMVLFVGQLHAYKGFVAVLDAARALAGRGDLVFVFAGPDVRGNARAFEKAGANVRWVGRVDNATRDSLLNACTVLCVPSARESFGSVVIEAWSSGKPVIGGPAAATRELIEDGVDGWTVPQDGRVIADRIERLVGDPALARRLGEHGRKKVAEKFSWASIAQAHLDLYAEVLQRSRRA